MSTILEIKPSHVITTQLTHINNLSNYLLHLINDLIQYASDYLYVRASKKEFLLKDVADFSYDVLKTLVECNESKSSKVQTYLKYDERLNDVVISSDEIKLKQILLNFISNSVKFTFFGFIRISFKQKKDFIKVSIKDTGIGIKEEDKECIFTEDDGKLNLDGVKGLGLKIVQSLSKLLNFKIGFTSKYERGSVFSIKIPFSHFRSNIVKSTVHKNLKRILGIKMSPESPQETKSNISELIRGTNKQTFGTSKCEKPKSLFHVEGQLTVRKDHDLKKLHFENASNISIISREIQCFQELYVSSFELAYEKKSLGNNDSILIIDDHKLIRDNTRNLLITAMKVALPERVIDILEGQDGIDLLHFLRNDKQNKIKLIFLDENMEYLNGSDAVRIIRKMEENNKLYKYKIVSLTAYDDIETRKRILSSGINDILSKPSTKSEFCDIIKKYFQK